MAAGDKESPGEGDEETQAPRASDLRVGSHDDMGVRVSRDLRGTEGNARGHGANFSKMTFSSRGVPRDEVVVENPAPARTAAAALAPPPATPAETSDDPVSGGVVSWLAGLIKRR